MRWIDRIWREDRRAKATPARIATVLADGVIRSTNVLRIQIQQQAATEIAPPIDGIVDHRDYSRRETGSGG